MTDTPDARGGLASYIRNRLKHKKILLMTHIVMGYPSFEESYQIVRQMVEAGVDLMELQIPFSEPMADGPVILRANQQAIEEGSTVEKCLAFAKKVAGEFDIPFLFMSYANILYKYGMDRFAKEMAQRGLTGAIVPDLPPEESRDYLAAMTAHGLRPSIFSPRKPPTGGWNVSMRFQKALYTAWPGKASPVKIPIFPGTWPITWGGAANTQTFPWPWASG